MEQDRPVRDVGAVEVWDEARDKAEGKWVAHLRQVRVETAYAPTAAIHCLT